jgi:(S)-ureidoglycine aminohydrolase
MAMGGNIDTVKDRSGDWHAGVYPWPPDTSAHSAGPEVIPIRQGGTAYLHSLEAFAVSVPAGASLPETGAAGSERLVLIRDGDFLVKLCGEKKKLRSRSIVFILPGDDVAVSNTGTLPGLCWVLHYRSKTPPDFKRGREAGSSFALNGDDLVCLEHDRGRLWRYFDRPTAMTRHFEMHVTALKPGIPSHEPHVHGTEEFLALLDGSAAIALGETQCPAMAGDLVFLKSDEAHALANTGARPCVYFAFQWD